MMQHAKVVVIGLDSFDPVLARAWIDAGKLPNLARQFGLSISGDVRNPPGLEAASVWSSFSFGADPGRHGMFDGGRDFSAAIARRGSGTQQSDVRPLWSILEDGGKRCIVIEVPVVPDGAEPQGIRVTNWFSHLPPEGQSTLTLSTHPPALREIIERDYAPDPLEGRMCDFYQPRAAADMAWFRDAMIERVRTKTALARDLMAREPWDFFLVGFEDAHCAGHQCFHLVDPTAHDHDPEVAAVVGNPLLDIYEAIDEAVGALVAQAGPSATVLIFLSHGLEPAFTGLRLLDRILARLNGELHETRNSLITTLRYAWRMLPQPVRGMLRPLHVKARESFYGNGFLPSPETRICHEVYTGERASGIRINLAGRDAGGMVQPGEDYEALCNRLIEQLGAICNDGTGEPLVSEIVRTRDHYAGPMAGTLPDLLVTWNRHAPIPSVSSPAIGRLRHPHPSIRTGDHSPDGLFLLAGPGIAAQRLNHYTDVIDLAPSLAAMFGVSSPTFQGRAVAALAPRV